jgi:hypothetical protein
MESGGLSVRFDTLTRLKGTGWLGIVGPTSAVARLMEITGLTDQPGFKLLPDLTAAAHALENAPEAR